jgi:hypothetical protein
VSSVTIAFIDGLVGKYPGLKPILDEHLSDNFGEVLPHLFFGDLTRYVVSRFLDFESAAETLDTAEERELGALLNDLEQAYSTGDEEIQELISVSFLENLPRPSEEASELRSWLGPELTKQLGVIG